MHLGSEFLPFACCNHEKKKQSSRGIGEDGVTVGTENFALNFALEPGTEPLY